MTSKKVDKAGIQEPKPTADVGSFRRALLSLRWFEGPRVAIPVMVCALAVYILTLAPTVTTEDSGELVTAAVSWGVAHPPGYPLYCLVLQPFVRLPLWNPAFGANLASALFGALTAGGITLITLRLGAATSFAAAAGLLWAFGRDVWAQSVIAEVYTLNAFLLVAIVYLVLRFAQERRMRYVYCASFLFGVSLSNHYPLMFLSLPALVWFVARASHWGAADVARTGTTAKGGRSSSTTPSEASSTIRKPRLWSVRSILTTLGLVVPGLAFYAYLPLAARKHPALNWGDPSQWSSFWAHVSRAAYRKLEVGHVSTANDKAQFLGLFADHLASQWTAPVLLLFGGLGFVHLRKKPRERNLLLAIALLSGVGLTLILNYDYDQENIQRLDEFYLPVYAALAPLLGVGLSRAADEILQRAPSFHRAALFALPAVFVVPLVVHFHHNHLSHDDFAREYNRFILDSLPQNSVYFTSGDYTSFPSLYLQAVENKRPDILLADFTGELSPRTLNYLKEIDPSVDPTDRAAVQTAFLERGQRKMFVAAKSDLKVPARVDPWGLVYFVWGKQGGPGGKLPPLLSTSLAIPEPIPEADGLLRSAIADYHLMRGEAMFVAGNKEGAIESYKLAVFAQPLSKESVNNVASTAAERNFVSDAERWFLKAAALSPTYITPRRNLARMMDTAGRRQEAIEAYRELLRVAPDDAGAKTRLEELIQQRNAPPPSKLPDSRIEDLLLAIQKEPGKPALHNNLGNVYAEQGDAKRALASYEKAIKLDPDYALAYKNMALVHRDILRDPAAAERYFEKYKSLSEKP